MPSRRQEKIARVIKQSVSETIINRLNDPRIKGIVSVTDVEVSPDSKNATVGLSIMTEKEVDKKLTFKAIQCAAGVIQHELGLAMSSKYCPHLRLVMDTKMQKTLETLKLIDQVSEELHQHDNEEHDDVNPENPPDMINQ